MHDSRQGYEVVSRTRHRKECAELQLVLTAIGIHTETVHQDGQWLLTVRHGDLPHAMVELESYRRENPESADGGQSDESKPVPLYGGAAMAVIVYAGTVILIDVFAHQNVFGLNWYQAGQMHAGSVLAGQWWRVVTALTLHSDLEHVLSNLLFGSVFGFLAGRILGGGVAWLGIVVAGALGNFINALVQPPAHLSIGASTAVFAALGMIVAHSLRTWVPDLQRQKTNSMKRWSPLIGGALLFAYLGIGGERTDVTAHATGFMAGLLIGWIECRIPARLLSMSSVQWLAGIGAIALVTAAWSQAALIGPSP